VSLRVTVNQAGRGIAKAGYLREVRQVPVSIGFPSEGINYPSRRGNLEDRRNCQGESRTRYVYVRQRHALNTMFDYNTPIPRVSLRIQSELYLLLSNLL